MLQTHLGHLDFLNMADKFAGEGSVASVMKKHKSQTNEILKIVKRDCLKMEDKLL